MFQDTNDPLQVVVLNTHAGGESITLDAADEMVIVDGPWLSDTEDQLTARIHRVSRIHQVTVYRLASVGTVDTWIAGMTDEQREALVSAAPQKLSDMLKEEEAA
jgi:SNF2 family DNA or RNA helicase